MEWIYFIITLLVGFGLGLVAMWGYMVFRAQDLGIERATQEWARRKFRALDERVAQHDE